MLRPQMHFQKLQIYKVFPELSHLILKLNTCEKRSEIRKSLDYEPLKQFKVKKSSKFDFRLLLICMQAWKKFHKRQLQKKTERQRIMKNYLYAAGHYDFKIYKICLNALKSYTNRSLTLRYFQ